MRFAPRLALPECHLELTRWPPRLDGLRVALIADLHAGGPGVGLRALDRLVDSVNAAAPDLVALVGDYVDPQVVGGGRLDPAAVARRLARLRAPGGTVGVLGNQDWRNEGHTVVRVMRHAGLRLLENEAVRLWVRGGPLWVAGVGDLRKRDPRVGSALTAVPDDEPVLLLAHDPDVFPYVPARVSVTLSGHLHGGQIDLPLVRRLMPTRHGTRFKEGHVTETGRHLFVTRGVGEATLPVRIRARPEVPILTLRSSVLRPPDRLPRRRAGAAGARGRGDRRRAGPRRRPRSPQVAVKLPDELVGEIDRLVGDGAFASRSQAGRRGLEALVAARRSEEVDRRYRDAFDRHPETDEELRDAQRLALESINEEPWERWW